MSVKSLVIIVEMRSDTPDGNSLGLRTTCLWAVEFSGSHLTKTATLTWKTRNVEYNWPVGPPMCKLLVNGIFEMRSNISAGRTARVFFFIESNGMYLLHGFIKKITKDTSAGY